MNPTTIRLVADEGMLFFPHGGNVPGEERCLLLCVYAAGDCDTCPWPLACEFTSQRKLETRLARALYDLRECNSFFPSSASIELPDGTPFDCDMVLASQPAPKGWDCIEGDDDDDDDDGEPCPYHARDVEGGN